MELIVTCEDGENADTVAASIATKGFTWNGVKKRKQKLFR